MRSASTLKPPFVLCSNMASSRRSFLAVAGGTVAAVAGCLNNDLPLFEVDVYNATDSAVTAEVTVVAASTGSTVVSKMVRVAGTDGERRRTVTQEFEEGKQYEVMVSVGERSNGELFRADEEGARKLTFEVHEDAVLAEYA
jgi:hypothetical protein